LSIRFQADNGLKRIIVDATLRREPRIDFQTARAARLDDLDDEAVLHLAASQSRILVSHDKRTMRESPCHVCRVGRHESGRVARYPLERANPRGS
jgi:hypothetical protein